MSNKKKYNSDVRSITGSVFAGAWGLTHTQFGEINNKVEIVPFWMSLFDLASSNFIYTPKFLGVDNRTELVILIFPLHPKTSCFYSRLYDYNWMSCLWSLFQLMTRVLERKIGQRVEMEASHIEPPPQPIDACLMSTPGDSHLDLWYEDRRSEIGEIGTNLCWTLQKVL